MKTKIDVMIDNLHIALAKVEETKALMMDSNTNSIFWNKIDVIEADLAATIKVLGETDNAAD